MVINRSGRLIEVTVLIYLLGVALVIAAAVVWSRARRRAGLSLASTLDREQRKEFRKALGTMFIFDLIGFAAFVFIGVRVAGTAAQRLMLAIVPLALSLIPHFWAVGRIRDIRKRPPLTLFGLSRNATLIALSGSLLAYAALALVIGLTVAGQIR
jgi:hypothetical protein